MHRIITLARATYGEIVRRPLYYILLLSFAVAVFGSRFLTLFSFYQERQMVREMGMATLTFWAFLIVVLLSGVVVTQELDDRTAVTLLSKPLRRAEFLLGKFFGIVLSLIPGMIVLAGALFMTLWFMSAPRLPLDDRAMAEEIRKGSGAFAAAWDIVWRHFVVEQGGVVLEGALLSFFQGAVLAAIAVSFSAFFPGVVSVSATTLVFILGNISSYLTAGAEKMGVAPIAWAGRAFGYVMPNLGYFNLQTSFSEGKLISVRYLGLAGAYAVVYVGAVFLVSCSLFRKREIR